MRICGRVRAVRVLTAAVAVALFFSPPPRVASAQDAEKVSPKVVKLLFENDRVRVLETISNPGDREDWHSHPANVLHILAGGKLRITTRDGKVSVADFKTGETLYRPPVTHSAENIGTTTLHAIIVELKQP